MTSKCSIKRKLPPAPKTATKTVHDPRIIGDGRYTAFHRPSPSPIDSFGHSEKAVANSHKAQSEKMLKRQAIVKELARKGASDEEISQASGYALGSVRRLLWKWRQDGEDIPVREKGRKKCKR